MPVEMLQTEERPQLQITERELLLKMTEVAQREARLLRKELELELELELLRSSDHSVEGSRQATSSTAVTWRDVKNVIRDYDGSDNCDLWIRQIEKVIHNYALDYYGAKALICAKLEERALRWYNTQEDYMDLSHVELLARIQKMLGAYLGIGRNIRGLSPRQDLF
ncbi:hypothetical protein WN48_07860 [Eufriesea mexicana]|nr:hypothetical protein WN48_07860 [Eufriesea mexicana]